MKKKLLISALASIALFSSTGVALTSIKPNDVQATKMPNQKYIKKFYKVRITKKTTYYKVIRGRDEAHNKYKKMGYLKPGQIVYIRGRGVVWGWTIGKKYKYCSFRSSFQHKLSGSYRGLYTNMNAIRKEEDLDNFHSIYSFA